MALAATSPDASSVHSNLRHDRQMLPPAVTLRLAHLCVCAVRCATCGTNGAQLRPRSAYIGADHGPFPRSHHRRARACACRARAASPEKPSLIGLTPRRARRSAGRRRHRARAPGEDARQQLWHWLYVRGVTDFAEMTNISKDLRADARRAFHRSPGPRSSSEQISTDGTRKWLFRFPPRGAGRPVEIETVYIPEEGRGTLCVSSQVGCTLTCTFCHTGTQKLVRNLTADEILGQLLIARDRLGDFPDRDTPDGAIVPAEGRIVSNIVMMGMGEPLYNFDNVKKALLIASDGDGLSLSQAPHHALDLRRRAGDRAAPARRSASCWRSRCTPPTTSCATCWCRSTRSIRSKELLAACRAYPGLSNARRITFEYVMLKDVNDFLADATRAGPAAQGHPGQDQPDPVQSLAGHQLRVLGLGDDRELRRLSSTTPATPRRSAPRAAATSSPPAASSSRNPSA